MRTLELHLVRLLETETSGPRGICCARCGNWPAHMVLSPWPSRCKGANTIQNWRARMPQHAKMASVALGITVKSP